jgi:hypothetical protein
MSGCSCQSDIGVGVIPVFPIRQPQPSADLGLDKLEFAACNTIAFFLSTMP